MKIISVLALSVFFTLNNVYASDVVKIDAPVDSIDKRNDFTNLLLSEILRKTGKKYGKSDIQYAPVYMHRERLLDELIKGDNVTITAKATQPEWESSKLITIRIPVDKGINEYRIFFIRKDDQTRFSAIKKVEDLKSMTLGVGHAWSTYKVFRELGFKTAPSSDWEGLYRMLAVKRFDYFPRALSEIFVEYDDRKKTIPDLAIEQSLVIYFPLPKYFFVSPKYPRLAERIETGFKQMILDGSFDALFFKYHAGLIRRANFKSRRLFRLPNPLLSPQTPLSVPEYWYDPYR
jgi:hypothetical protein